MGEHATYDDLGHAFFLTFSCYKRRRLLDADPAKAIVLDVLTSQLSKQDGKCAGFVIMPDHVHAVVWFGQQVQLSYFMKQWKQRSSIQLKRNLKECQWVYAKEISWDEPIWQAGYYSFNIYSEQKLIEKMNYMHSNPVKAGLVDKPEKWQYSSSRHYALGASAGINLAMPG
ncbi:MAG: transposase [Desulfarculus sp.]|nr:transposase [Desulfarculus sp.]